MAKKLSKINSVVTKKLWQNPEYRKSHIEATKRSHNTLEFKNKMSMIKKGKHQSPSTEFHKGYHQPVEWIEKMRQKKIGVTSDKRGKNYEELYGNQRALEIRQKQAQKHINKKLSEVHRQAISKAHKQNFEDKNYKKKWARRFHRKPGPAEKKMIELINSSDLPFKYVGDYKLWIGNKNPDFVHNQGKTQVVELFGEYWHQTKPSIKQHQTAEGTMDHYKKAGYKCLIVWSKELKKDPQLVLQKIKAFSESN